MAYQKRKGSRRKGKKTYGKVFRTKRGILGQYCYVNGKRVGFERLRENATPAYMRKKGRAYARRK